MLTNWHSVVHVKEVLTRYGTIRLCTGSNGEKVYGGIASLASVAAQHELLFGVDAEALEEAGRNLWEAIDTFYPGDPVNPETGLNTSGVEIVRAWSTVDVMVGKIEAGLDIIFQRAPTTLIEIDDSLFE
jgi:hypothetical protein